MYKGAIAIFAVAGAITAPFFSGQIVAGIVYGVAGACVLSWLSSLVLRVRDAWIKQELVPIIEQRKARQKAEKERRDKAKNDLINAFIAKYWGNIYAVNQRTPDYSESIVRGEILSICEASNDPPA